MELLPSAASATATPGSYGTGLDCDTGAVTAGGGGAHTACSSGSVKETLGLERSAPDEFRVVSRPPLSVPPQFTLRPPVNSDVSPNEASASDQAKSLVLGGKAATAGSADTAIVSVKVVGNNKASTSKISGADSQFLKNAGADIADPKVRDALSEEHYAVQEKEESSSWWDIFSSGPEKKDPLVDAKKESERITKNDQNGQPVTEGKTPETKDRDTGVLGRLLGY